jgi:hypothetical protein
VRDGALAGCDLARAGRELDRLELLLDMGIAWPARLAGSLPGPALFAPLLASLRALLGRTVRV